MKNKYKFLAALGLGFSSLFAQKIIPCFTDEATKYYFDTHPAEKARYEKEKDLPVFTEEYKKQLAERSGGNNSVQTVYALDTIPVVFHILHQNGPEKIPASYVYNALAEVNRVHTKTIPDTASIDPLFKGISGANNYIFKLATKDPSGNCTNGIIYHLDPNTDWDQTNFSNYAYTWPPTKYLNVYIVRNICQGQPCPGSTSGGIIVGYTYLPGTWGSGAVEDAVVYNYQFMNNGTDARSMAHEFGHWLDLQHTFGNTNTPGTCLSGGQSDDFLSTKAPAVACTGVTDDTPKYYGAFSTCPPASPNSCDVSNTANVQNIMDYSSCPKNFTNGQIRRMHNIMGSTTSGRSTVVSASNKVATGIRNPIVCVPVANFHPSTLIACPGSIIVFSDSSGNAHPTSWNWSFPGGTLQNGTTVNDSMPQVSYAAAGTYAVSYTATTTAGSNSITKNALITIISNVASYNSAFAESFETATLPGTDWSVEGSGLNWAVTNTAGASGTHSAFIDNFSNSPGTNSSFISPSFNISGFATPKLTFKYAYQQQASTNVDKLQIFSSTDCEKTWTSRWSRSGTTLANVTPASGFPLTPTPSQFMTYTVNINGVAGSNNVRFKFEFFADVNGQGNDIYVDDINVYDASVGIQTIESQVGLEIYPNPSSGNVTIGLALNEKRNISVAVTDVLGRTVETIASKQYAAGETKIVIAEKTVYEAGVYVVNLNVDGNVITKKIVIK